MGPSKNCKRKNVKLLFNGRNFLISETIILYVLCVGYNKAKCCASEHNRPYLPSSQIGS